MTSTPDTSPPPSSARNSLLSRAFASSPLRHPHFRNVQIAAFGSSVGTWMESVGVQWLMAEQTRSPIMMGWLAAAQMGPMLCLGLLGGLVADRVNRKTLLMCTGAAMMIIAALLALASYHQFTSPTFLIVLSLFQGIATAFNIPAWQVLTPRLVQREELARAITINGMQFNLARVVGPGLGGVLMALYGPTILFTINSLSFVGVIIAVAATPDAPAMRQGQRLFSGAWAQIGQAFSFVFRSPGPRAIFLGLTLFATLAVPIIRFLPLFVSEVFHAEERTYGLLLSIMGVGAVAGGFLKKLIPSWYPTHHLLPLSILCGATSVLAFALAPNVPIASVTIFFVGVFWLWTFTTALAAMQLLVAEEMRGRVMAVCNTATFGAMPLGSVLVGALGESIVSLELAGRTTREMTGLAVRSGVGAAAIVLLIAALVMLIWRTPEIDALDPGQSHDRRRPALLRGLTASNHRPPRAPDERAHATR